VKELQLEMEEMHDQFREEETTEIRELQRELETTAKACRIVNFKLRKVCPTDNNRLVYIQ